MKLESTPGSPFGAVTRPVELTSDWPNSHSANDLCGPVVIDVFEKRREADDLVIALIESAVRAAEAFGYPPEFINSLRSSAWRSAHKFVAQNVHSVDRGAELDELAKLLGVRSDG